MSTFIHTRCACGMEIIAVSADEDDIRIAVAAHNDLPKHTEWRAVQELQRKPRRGKCICRGRDVTNSPHTPQEGESLTDRAPATVRFSVIPRVKVEV